MSDLPNLPVIFQCIATITGNAIEERPELQQTSIFELGIDSLNVIELIFLLETELGVEIPLAEFDEDAFRSVAHLDAHLQRLQAVSVATSA